MTDAQTALAQVREAMAAGPTPGEWQKATDWSRAAVIQSTKPFKRVVCTGNQNNDDRFGDEDWSGATWVDADFIAACSPANMTAILAHVEAQAAEIERLTAALRHEADCVEAAKAEIERLQIGIELFDAADADLRTKLDAANDLAEMIASERDELRRQLAEAELDAQRYRWLRNEANTARKCDPMVCIYPLDEQDLIDGDRLDIAIDAAMGGSDAG